MSFIDEIIKIRRDVPEIGVRLEEFMSFKEKDAKEWFSELCFCLLTANSKAKTALSIQADLGAEGFCSCIADDVKGCIMKHKHRFHNNKTKFIIEAREHLEIKDKITKLVEDDGQADARQWLVDNIKGLGFKEASHFLRNVGFFDLAILDRHILRLLNEKGYIDSIPKSLTKKRYLEIEEIFNSIAKKINMSAAELDLTMWYMKTGKVLK